MWELNATGGAVIVLNTYQVDFFFFQSQDFFKKSEMFSLSLLSPSLKTTKTN